MENEKRLIDANLLTKLMCRACNKMARRAWHWMKLFNCFTPCEDCDNPFCRKPKNVIAYCPGRR